MHWCDNATVRLVAGKTRFSRTLVFMGHLQGRREKVTLWTSSIQFNSICFIHQLRSAPAVFPCEWEQGHKKSKMGNCPLKSIVQGSTLHTPMQQKHTRILYGPEKRNLAKLANRPYEGRVNWFLATCLKSESSSPEQSNPNMTSAVWLGYKIELVSQPLPAY